MGTYGSSTSSPSGPSTRSLLATHCTKASGDQLRRADAGSVVSTSEGRGFCLAHDLPRGPCGSRGRTCPGRTLSRRRAANRSMRAATCQHRLASCSYRAHASLIEDCQQYSCPAKLLSTVEFRQAPINRWTQECQCGRAWKGISVRFLDDWPEAEPSQRFSRIARTAWRAR